MSERPTQFVSRLLISAFLTAVVTLGLGYVLTSAQRSVTDRIDQSNDAILGLVSDSRAVRQFQIDAIYCVIASGDFSKAGVDECLRLNEVPNTYNVP